MIARSMPRSGDVAQLALLTITENANGPLAHLRRLFISSCGSGQQQGEHAAHITVNADGPALDLMGTDRLAAVDTGVDGVWIFRRHLPEGVLDNRRGNSLECLLA